MRRRSTESTVATRDRILNAAMERFSRTSYEQTGLRDIAADVGVDVAYVHRCFARKNISSPRRLGPRYSPRVDNESRSLFLLHCKTQVLALKTPPTSPSGGRLMSAAEDCARGVGPPLEVSITPRQLRTFRRHFLTMRAAVLF
jgi:AcrR family transcriptional regulator